MYRGEFKPSLEEYYNHGIRKSRESLLKEAREAVAWGMPCSESSGMSTTQLINLIAKLANYIERN